MKSQASMEYLIVVGIAFLVMIPAIYFFFSFSRESGMEISTNQLDAIGREIVQTSESIFYSGAGSKTTLTLTMPEGLLSARIMDQRELVFNISTAVGYSELVFFSRVNLTSTSDCHLGPCVLPQVGSPGAKKVQLTALNNSVLIEQVG